METNIICQQLTALSQDSRLALFRRLVQAGHDGSTPGVLSEKLDVAPATLSHHLNILKQAGLISVQRRGRHLCYTADFPAMNRLLRFMTENCCQGQPCEVSDGCCPDRPLNILFLCTGNSCRSQMAEGWARHLWGDRHRFFSAGTEQHGMNPRAVAVMKEAGADIDFQFSKTVDQLSHIPFDVVFTVCEHAANHCPLWLGSGKVVHVGFEDPPKLTAGLSEPREILDVYRRVRDQIREFIADGMVAHLL